MRLAVCTLSALLLSGCSWLGGMGNVFNVAKVITRNHPNMDMVDITVSNIRRGKTLVRSILRKRLFRQAVILLK